MITYVETIYENQSFPNAWVKAMREVIRNGKEINFGGGVEKKKAKDAHLTIVLEGRALQEAIEGKLHPQFPTKEKHKQAYIKEWARGYDWKKQGFTYCYGDRAEAYQGYKGISNIYHEIIPFTIDQWKLAKEDITQQIKTGIQSNRNVIVIGNPSIDRFEIPESPPCLREIWIRYEMNRYIWLDTDKHLTSTMMTADRAKEIKIDLTKVTVIPLISVSTAWRSRDLGTAWPVNVAGLLDAVKREVADPNGCEIVQYVDESRSLHVYQYDWHLFDEITPVPVNLAQVICDD